MYKRKTELYGKKFPVKIPQKSIDEVAKIHNLPNYPKITKTLISQIIVTDKHRVPYGQGSGFPAPLLKIENEVCNKIFAISKFHYPIRVSNLIQLINE